MPFPGVPPAYVFLFLMAGVPLASGQTSPDPGELVVNEVLYHQTDTQTEFIELFNRSDRAIDLRTLAVADNRDQPIPLTEAEHRIEPGAFAVLVDDAALFQSAYPSVPFVEPPGWNGLNNGGDAVILYAGDVIIDRVDYTPSWGGGDGISLERIDPFGPSDAPDNFGTSTHATGATPGAPNSIFAPDTTPPALVFAEVQSSNEALVVVSEPLAEASLQPDGFRLADGRSPAQLTALSATRLFLTFERAPDGPSLTATILRDRVGNVREDATIPLAYQAESGELAINEILFDPLADDFDDRPNQPEYVELYNVTDRTLTLRHTFWTDRPTEQHVADTTRIGSRFLSVAPQGFAVVFAKPDAEDNPALDSDLAGAFPAIDFTVPGVTLVPIHAAQLGLLNDGDLIRWHRADGTPTDEVAYHPNWHAPGLAETKGVALERISLTAPADDPTNWTSAVAADGGTPGAPNSVAVSTDASAPTNTVTVSPSPFSPDGDGIDDVARIQYQLETPASLARIRIYDARGRQVYHREAELVGPAGELLWNGRDASGHSLRLGIYIVLFEAVDAAGGSVHAVKRPVVLARPLH